MQKKKKKTVIGRVLKKNKMHSTRDLMGKWVVAEKLQGDRIKVFCAARTRQAAYNALAKHLGKGNLLLEYVFSPKDKQVEYVLSAA